MLSPHPTSTLFPSTTLFRSAVTRTAGRVLHAHAQRVRPVRELRRVDRDRHRAVVRSEEHTSELQSRSDLVCRLLLEKKKCRNPSHGTGTRTGSRTCRRIFAS